MELNQQQKRLLLLAEARRRQAQQQGGQQAPQDFTLGQRAEAAVDNIAESTADTFQVLGAEGVAQGLRSAFETPEGFVSESEKFLRPGEEGFGWSSLPGAAAEQAPQFALALGGAKAGALAGGRIGAIAGPKGAAIGAILGGIFGAAAPEALQVLGPTAMARAENNGRSEPNAEDIQAAAATAVASGAVNAVSPALRAGIGRVAVEGVTEFGQSNIQQTGESLGTDAGWEIDQKQAIGEGIIGAGSAAAVDGTIRGAQAARQAGVPQSVRDALSRTDNREFTDDEKRAAERLVRAADGKVEEILGNVNDTDQGSAKAAANAAYRGIQAEAAAIARDLRVLAKAEGNRDAEIALDAVLRTSRHQGSATPESFQSDLVSAYQALKSARFENADVERLGSLANQTNAIQSFIKGDKADMGGFSKTTSRFDLTDPRATTSLGGIAVASTGSIGTAGTLIAANRIARVVDRITNNRSRVKRFVDSALKDGKKPLPIEGPTSRDALKELQQRRDAEAAAEKLKLDLAIERAKAGGPVDPALRASMDAKGQAALDQIAKEQENRKLEEQATADLFQPGVQVPKPEGVDQSPIVAGHYMWQQATGVSPIATFQTLQELEAEGAVAPGTAQRYRNNIRSFDGDDSTPSLQRLVAQRRGTRGQGNFRPKPEVDPQAALDKFKAKLEGAKSRRNFKQLQGQRASAAVFEAIQKATPGLDAKTRERLLKLWQSMDSPGMTRDQRFETMNEALPQILSAPKHKALLKKMTPLFQDLAAAGNDVAFTRDEAEAKKEEEFDERRKAAPRKSKKRKGKRPANAEARPRSTEETAELALAKLKNRLAKTTEPVEPFGREDQRASEEPELPDEYYSIMGKDAPTPDGLKDVTPKEEEQKLLQGPEDRLSLMPPERQATERPKNAAQRRRSGSGEGRATNLVERVDAAVDKIAYWKDLAENEGAALDQYKANLPSGNTGKVMGIILDLASDRTTVNMVIDRFASQYGVSPQIAAGIVSKSLTELSQSKTLEVTNARGAGSLLKYDGKFVTDADGRNLYVRQISLHKPGTKQEVLDPEFARMVEIAKARRRADRMVPQDQDPEYDYGPNRLNWRGHTALKDIDPRRADQSFNPLFDFLNPMRNQRLALNLPMMSLIQRALPGVGKDRLGTIGEVLRPEGNKDEGPMRTFAQLLYHLGETEGGNLIRQEFMAGANGRVYAINGDASTQGGDLMKGVVRAPVQAKLGGADGFKFLMHGIGNLLDFDKEAPANRRTAIFDNNLVDPLLKFAEDPFSRYRLVGKNGEKTDIGLIAKPGKLFFQALNAALEVQRMVEWSKARHKAKAKKFAKNPAALLQDPEVQSDLADNYETDFIVQLDAANNAYQNAGMLMGEASLLQATGLLPPPGREGDPDFAVGADIYMEPAKSVASRVPELSQFPDKFLRSLFKRPIGTFLYAAEFNSRKQAFKAELEDRAGNSPIAGFEGENALFEIPETFSTGMSREDGASVLQVKYDVEGEIKEAKTVLKRLKQTDKGWKIEQKDGPKAKWKTMGSSFDSAEDAIREAYLGDLFARMNQELIREMNTRYPNVRKFLDYARTVSDMARDRGLDHVKVPTADGMILHYSFKEAPFFEAAEVDIDGKKARIGIRSQADPKLVGRGLAAFMAHQMDAYVLREVYRRMVARLGREPKVFNPIHDSYGFHPSEAKMGQEIWNEVMFDLGQPDYNLFLQILEANVDPNRGDTIEGFHREFKERGGPVDLLVARQGVQRPAPGSNPTALS